MIYLKDNKKSPSEFNYQTRMIDQLEQELQTQEIDFNDRETKEAGRYLQKLKLIGMTSTVASIRKHLKLQDVKFYLLKDTLFAHK